MYCSTGKIYYIKSEQLYVKQSAKAIHVNLCFFIIHLCMLITEKDFTSLNSPLYQDLFMKLGHFKQVYRYKKQVSDLISNLSRNYFSYN